MISGSRGGVGDDRIIMVEGIATGIAQVTAHIKLAGQGFYNVGATKTVAPDGSFTWQRKTNKKAHVYFDGDGVRSNLVTIPAR